MSDSKKDVPFMTLKGEAALAVSIFDEVMELYGGAMIRRRRENGQLLVDIIVDL